MNAVRYSSHVKAHHIFRTTLHGLLAVFLIAQSFGCAALMVGAAGGTAGAVFFLGKLTEEINASVPTIHQATLAALKELDLPIEEERGDKITAKITSEFSDGKNIWISLESKTRSTTEIIIRVGHMGEGDESRSRMLLTTIKKHL
ncbi:MAG: DUF3568 family protein [Nitrospirales bacterium]|nr:DUF3568 family protein [Nitrospirales bacterium]